ncbi:MAG TPA: hypothetical protein VIM83_00430, partial [Candidatus Limnocylindria bacterium]
MRGARFLLTFDEQRDPAGRLSAVRPQRGKMRRDAGLVIRDATAVEPAVALGRREWIGLPRVARSRRLHVMVGIEEDRRRPRRTVDPSDDRGMRAVLLDHAGVDACGREKIGGQLRRLADRCGVVAGRAHRWHTRQALEA